MSVWAKLDELVRRDLGRRGVGRIHWANPLEEVARCLAGARSVLLATGFVHAASGRAETDGPPGTAALGRALRNLRIPTGYVTDAPAIPLLRALRLDPVHMVQWRREPRSEWRGRARELLRTLGPTHLVAIERAGRTGDGTYRNVRGMDISAVTEPVDELFLAATDAGLWSLGIGDGGNEIGMGCLSPIARDTLAGSLDQASEIATTRLVVAGVSNWGALGVVAGLQLVTGRTLLPHPDELEADLAAVVQGGGVDGITGRAEPSVDGLSADLSLTYLQDLTRLVGPGQGSVPPRPPTSMPPPRPPR